MHTWTWRGWLLAVLTITLSSQAIPAHSAPQPITPDQAAALALNQVHAASNNITVENRRHRASFTDRGVEFQPRSGPSWHWRLDTIGTAAITIHAFEPIQPATSRNRIDYSRGPVTERYIVKAHSVEQQFILEQPLPLQRDDLIITGHIESPGRLERHPQGWLWRNAEGVVSLGRVTVIDARGVTLPARMTVTAGTSRIHVSGNALAQAAYPVVIDPEIGTNDFRISDMGTDGSAIFGAFSPAVAYNSSNDEYLVVWAGDDNSGSLVNNEQEIFGQRIDAFTGNPLGDNDFRISDMGPDSNALYSAGHPAVAYNATDNEYLVVWEGEDGNDAEFEIYGQRLDGTSGAEMGNNDFRISDMGTDADTRFDALRPAVAYNATANEYLVVWHGDDVIDEFEIYGQRLEAASGAETGVNDFRISDMGPDGSTDFLALHPAVAYNATDDEYLVVWEGDDDTAPLVDDEKEIFGQRLAAATGTEIGGNDFRISDMGPDGSATFQALNPAVAYNATANEYLVVWEGDDDIAPLVDNEKEIFGQRLDGASGAETGSNDFRISDMGPDGNTAYQAVNPAVAYNASDDEYLVVWEGDDDTAPLVDDEKEIFAQRLAAATGAETGSNDFPVSDMGPDGDTNFDAGLPAVLFNPPGNEYLITWQGDDSTGALVDDEQEIYGQRFAVSTALRFSAGSITAGEASGNASITVQRVGDPGNSVMADYASSDGSAAAPGDYTAASGQVSFAASETTKSFAIPINDDGDLEGDETVNLALSNPAAGSGSVFLAPGGANATLTIDDDEDDVILQLSSTALSVTEGNVNATFTVTRTGLSSGTASVDFATSDNTATAGTDYTAASGTLNWADGDTADKTFDISIGDDTQLEGDESLTVTLSNAAAGAGDGTIAPGRGTAVLTIQDNDATLQFSTASYSVDEDTGTATITVTRIGSSIGTASIDYATADGTAIAGSDYTSTTGTLNWADGDAADKNFSIAVNHDAEEETDETVTLRLTNATGSTTPGNPDTATLTIRNVAAQNNGGGGGGGASPPLESLAILILLCYRQLRYSAATSFRHNRNTNL